MSQTKLHYQCLLLFIIIKINLISGQTCNNSIPDFFYNVNIAGPIFNQAVYTTETISVNTENDTKLFTFNVKPQTDYTRPSFIPSTATVRALIETSENISVTSSDPSFVVRPENSIAGVYSLFTNTFPLKYFSPFNRYLFKLIAKQTISNDRPPVVSTAIVQINLKNDNVNCPILISNSQTFYISKTAELFTEFGTLYATDADNDTITYSICNTQFEVDQSTGVLRLVKVFDSSSPSVYLVNVTAMDDGTTSCPPFNMSHRCYTPTFIRIIVTTVNENPPRFLGDLCGKNISFNENNEIGYVIKDLCVLDNDGGANESIDIAFPPEHLRTTVSGWRNTAYSQFSIEQLNQTDKYRWARIKANERFDYDSPGAIKSWYLFIIATDSGKPPRQAFCSLRLNLLDVNDNSPIFFMRSWNFTITRNTTRFLRIIASDADSGVNGMIDYYMPTNVSYFTINQTTGTIMLRSSIPGIASLNVSHFPITFEVYAQDRGTPPRISERNATVTIYYNANGESPQATWDPRYEELNIMITERFYEQFPDEPIFDNSTGFNGSIYYRLTSQTSIMTVCSAFLDNKTIPFRDVPVIKEGERFQSGITVTRGLHAEIQNFYQLYIRVLVNPPLIGSVTIRLKDENDQIPTFDIRSIELTVLEKETGVRSIAQIQAFDRDVDHPNNFVQYILNKNISDPDVSSWFFVELNGTIWTNAIFDSKNRTFYRLVITAYDGARAYNSKTDKPNTQDFQFDVRVISINDNPPSFINVTNMVSIDETTVNGTNILYLNITDSDIDTNLNLGILSGNDRNAFTFTLYSENLDDASRANYEAVGQLKVVAPLDYESKEFYTLVLFAFDGKNMAKINVTVNLTAKNTKAPKFNLRPGSTSYNYAVTEGRPDILNDIQVVDPDKPTTTNFTYQIFNSSHQLDLSNIDLNATDGYITIIIKSPGLSRDLPYGSPVYSFSINVTDEGGFGVSSYVPVSITVNDVNNNAPIPVPTNGLWIIEEGINSTIDITFEDYDDPEQGNTLPFTIDVVSPPEFKRSICPTVTSDKTCKFQYNGDLNRTSMKNFSVQFRTSDARNYNGTTTISIIVSDYSNIYPISDGSKIIKVIYVNGYQNSLHNVDLGSIYVKDLNDWHRASRDYTIRNEHDGNKFSTSEGFLRSSDTLTPRSYRILVDVTKNRQALPPSSALSTVHVDVESVDSEYVRQASTIRIQGEYPETLIDPQFGRPPLDNLRDALASLLSVTRSTIKILAIRPVFKYRNPYYSPKPFDIDKNETLSDVIFYILGSDKFGVECTLNKNRAQFQSRFSINVIAIGPNPCNDYRCPTDTICRPTRTIQPKPFAIDANQTSFVGINILDSPDCVNSTDISNECHAFIFDNAACGLSTSLSSGGSVGPCGEKLVRTFNGNDGGYARFNNTKFSNFAPTRFSFDFALQKMIPDGLILLYGRTSPPINNFSWIAIEISESKLRFRFREKIINATETILNASTWYHVECQLVGSTILLSINDCQYGPEILDDTLNTYNLSTVELVLGGLPTNDLLTGLYPSLVAVNTFNGCIRNVLSNGYYLDMSKAYSSANSASGECPCEITNSCSAKERVSIIPWYTWLIIALVLLLLATILAMILLTFVRRRRQLKRLAALYTDDARDNIIDYKETAGEEDHSTYNLRILKKPVYSIPNNDRFDYPDSWANYQPSLGDYIEQKLNERVLPYSNDTQLHYQYEGEGSIISNLSSIEPSPLNDQTDYRFLHSLGPKFSKLADLYTDNIDDEV